MSTSEDHARRTVLEENLNLLQQVEQVNQAQQRRSPFAFQCRTGLRSRQHGDGWQLRNVSQALCRAAHSRLLPVTLYAVCTHVAEAFDSIGYLAILSPTKGCGKSRLFEVLELLVRRPWKGVAPSVAALFRMISDGPTLLLDEVEIFNRKDKSEASQTLLAILNSGYRKGATIPRCVGPNHDVKHFPIYGPKCFAAIGRLPDTLVDRSITIRMQRRNRKSERIERFLSPRAGREAAPIRQKITAWVDSYRREISKTYEKTLDADLDFLTDRNAEIWIPLFSICALAAPERVPELRECAQALCLNKASDDTDDSLPLKLLADIRIVWPEGENRCDTKRLLEALKQLEESPWAEIALSARKLARLLRPFEIEPKVLRLSQDRSRGYEWQDVQAAFVRYIDSEA